LELAKSSDADVKFPDFTKFRCIPHRLQAKERLWLPGVYCRFSISPSLADFQAVITAVRSAPGFKVVSAGFAKDREFHGDTGTGERKSRFL